MDAKESAAAARLIFAKNLKHQLRQNNVCQQDLVTKFGITASTVSDWCTGKKYPRVDKIQLLADYFGVSRAALTEEPQTAAQAAGPSRRIPILGRVSAGMPLYAEQNIEGYTYTEQNGGAEYFALRVQGDSMNAARIQDGDVLVVRRQDLVENGEIAVVLVGDDETTVKRFYQSGRFITLVPQSLNPVYEPQNYSLDDVNVRVLGKVVENKICFE